MISGGPVAVAIEQCTDDSAVQHAGKCFVLRFRFPIGNDLTVFDEAAHVQPFGVRRSATKTSIFRSVLLLKRLLHDDVDLNCSEGRDISAAAVRRKASAVESIDYCRAARSH